MDGAAVGYRAGGGRRRRQRGRWAATRPGLRCGHIHQRPPPRLRQSPQRHRQVPRASPATSALTYSQADGGAVGGNSSWTGYGPGDVRCCLRVCVSDDSHSGDVWGAGVAVGACIDSEVRRGRCRGGYGVGGGVGGARASGRDLFFGTQILFSGKTWLVAWC